MPTTSLPASAVLAHRFRRWLIAALVVLFVVVLVALVSALARGASASIVPFAPFSPSAVDGLIRGDEEVTLADDDLSAIARLDAPLRDAMRVAEADAAADGISFQITSGWRSDAYQRWLLDDAIRFYASEEVARQYVAAPENSQHVTGHAVDVGPVDAQFWLIEHGSAYGICQTYANERWHFELATTPGGVCPEMKADAAS